MTDDIERDTCPTCGAVALRTGDGRMTVASSTDLLRAQAERDALVDQLAGAVEALDEALDLAAEALDVPAGYARHLKHLRERAAKLRAGGA